MRNWALASCVNSALAGLLQNEDVTKTAVAGSRAVTIFCAWLQFWRQVINRYLRVDLPQFGVCLDDI